MSNFLYFAQVAKSKIEEVQLSESQRKKLARRCHAIDAKLVHVINCDNSQSYRPILLVPDGLGHPNWEQPIWAPYWKDKSELTALLGDF